MTLTKFSIGAIDINAEEKDQARGDTLIDELKKMIYFGLLFGCSPSVGVPAETKFMNDISRALLDGCNDDMVCTFPDCLDSLQGTDVNIELVLSSTLRPYRLFFIHHVVRVTYGLIFV